LKALISLTVSVILFIVLYLRFTVKQLEKMTSESAKTSLCLNALQMAFWRRKPNPGLLHHSDLGSQYASKEYREHLGIMKMQQSMSRKGNCWDNAPY